MATIEATRPIQAEPPAWASLASRVTEHVMYDLGGGPRPWKLAWVIDFQKAGTFPFLGLLMAWYGDVSPAAWVYLALHGGYGVAWIIKDLTFPDPAWQRRATIGGGLASFFLVLAWYWSFGWLLISGVSKPTYPLPEPAWFGLCITIVLVGTTIMVAADAQYVRYALVRRPS